MASRAELTALITLAGKVDPSLATALGAASKKLKELGGSNFADKLEAGGKKLTSMGKTMTKTITAPVVALGTAGFKSFMDFDDAVRDTMATLAEPGAYDALTAASKEAAMNSRYNMTQSATALGALASAGYDSEQSIALLPKVLDLATAGGLDLAQAASIVTGSMATLGIGVDGMDEFLNQMSKSAQASNADIEALGEGISAVGGTANRLAGGTTELATHLGILNNANIQGAEAGTHLRNVILSLGKAGGKEAKQLKKLGISAYDNAGKMKGLDVILGELNEKTAGMSDKKKAGIMENLFGKTDLAAVEALMGSMDGDWQALNEQIQDSAGSMEVMKKIMDGGIGGAMRRLMNMLNVAMVTIGDKIAPYVEQVADGIGKGIEWFNNLDAGAQDGLVKTLMALAAVGPGLIAVGKSMIGLSKGIKTVKAMRESFQKLKAGSGVMGLLTNHIGLVIAAVVALAVAAYFIIQNWDQVSAFFINLWAQIKGVFSGISAWFTEKWAAAKAAVMGAWNGVVAKAQEVRDGICAVFAGVGAWFTEKFAAVRAGVLTAFAKIGWFASKAWENIVNIFMPIGAWFAEKFSAIRSAALTVFAKLSGFARGAWNGIVSVFTNIGAWFTEKFSAIRSAALTGFAKISSFARGAWNGITAVFATIGAWFGEKFGEIRSAALGVFARIVSFASTAWANITGFFADIGGWFGEKFREISPEVEAAVSTVSDWASTKWDEMSTAFNNGDVGAWFAGEFNDLAGTISGVVGDAAGWASDAWGTISTAFGEGGNMHTWATSTFGNIGGTISGVIGDAAGWASTAWESISNAFGGEEGPVAAFTTMFSGVPEAIESLLEQIPTWISGTFTETWGSAWDTVSSRFGTEIAKIGDLVKAPINAVIDIVNNAIGAINGISVDIPDWIPGIGGNHFGMNVPTLSKLAKGATLTAPTLALLAEAGFPETVVPHNTLARSQSLAREAMVGTGQSLGGGSPVFDIQISINGEGNAGEAESMATQIAALVQEKIDAYWAEKERIAYGY